MRRIMFLFAGLFLLGTGLSGCGDTPDAAESVVAESSIATESAVTESSDTAESAVAEKTEKQELILAGIDLDASILSAVTSFNQASDDIVITIRDYGDSSGVLSDDMLVSIYKDIVAEDIPDMFLMSSSPSWFIDALITQGAFTDLNPLLDSDPAISRSDFFAPILETVQRDDKLFYFPISYTLNGIWGPPEYSGNSNRFPVDRIAELRQLYPENDMLFGGLSAMELIGMELSQNYNLYVNWEAKECDFISERFLDVLEAAYHLPGYRPAGRDERLDLVTGVYLLEGRQFFAPYTVTGFESYLMMTTGVAGEVDVVFNPYNSDMVSMTLTDSAVVLDVRSLFAISSACSDPKAAWQFLGTFLEPEYQQSLPAAQAPALPVNIQAFTAETDRLLADGKGTEAGFNRIVELIEVAETVNSLNTQTQIELLIFEEVSAYFSDDITAEEAARKIQDRVSAYLAEY